MFPGSGLGAATVDPSKRFVYALGSPALGSNSISAFTINASTGGLTEVTGSPYATGDGPVSVTVDPSDHFVYVANDNSNNISAYTIDSDTGALTPVTGSPFASGQGPGSVAIDPSGQFAYVGNEDDSPGGDVSGYTIDATTGALTPMDGSPFLSKSGGFGVTVAPSGKFGYVGSGGGAQVTAFSINPTTGVPTAVAGSPFLGAGTGSLTIAVSPSSKFVYAVGGDNISAFSVNATTGKLTSVKGSPFAAGSDAFYATMDSAGTRLYVTTIFGSTEVWTYKIAASGALTVLNKVRTPQVPAGVALLTGSASVTYTPKFAYVANSGSNNISAYTIKATNGHTTAVSGSPFPAGTTPNSVAVDPSGRFAYAANVGSNNVSAYTINSSTGALTEISGSPFPAGSGPDAVAVDPSGRFVYVTNGRSMNISAFTINASTGALTAISGSPFAAGGAKTEPISVTVDPSGQFVYVTSTSTVGGSGNISASTINASTGALTAVTGSPFATGVNYPGSLAVDPSGRFAYVGNEIMIDSAYVMSSFAIDATNGALTFVSYSSPLGTGTFWVTTHPLGQFVYAAEPIGTVAGLSVNFTTGALTQLTDSPYPAQTDPISVSVDPSGKFAYVANAVQDTITAYAIDETTGDLNVISGEFGVAAGTGPRSVVTTGIVH